MEQHWCSYPAHVSSLPDRVLTQRRYSLGDRGERSFFGDAVLCRVPLVSQHPTYVSSATPCMDWYGDLVPPAQGKGLEFAGAQR